MPEPTLTGKKATKNQPDTLMDTCRQYFFQRLKQLEAQATFTYTDDPGPENTDSETNSPIIPNFS